MSSDPTETIRREMVEEINAQPSAREMLEAVHGQVWDTQELGRDFEVEGFMAPFIVARKKSTGELGSLEFQHDPRYYYAFRPDGR